MSKDDSELNKLLTASKSKPATAKKAVKSNPISFTDWDDDEDEGEKKTSDIEQSYVQWSTHNGKIFVPASKTKHKLTPGVYEIDMNSSTGLFFEKIPVKTEGLLRFPETNSDKVVDEITKFWEKGETFAKYGLSYKRGILLWGPPGCHAAGTKILMFDGNLKLVEDVVIGDLLMGPDSKPRKVLELKRGQDLMYRIFPTKGESFVVNGHHILSLKRTRDKETNYPKILNCSVNDYLAFSKCAQRSFKLWHTGVEFQNINNEHPINPYFLGLWLGDGTESNNEITTADPEIKEYIYKIANDFGLKVTEQKKTDSICSSYALVGDGRVGSNPIRNALNDLNLFNNKHIPDMYLHASRSDRLLLLAGLIDTDGGYETASWRGHEKFHKKGYKGTFNICQKRDVLSQQIVFLAKSLGFGVTIKKRFKSIKETGFKDQYNCICIFGAISEIPVILPRKKAIQGLPNKDPLRTGIKEIEPLGLGNYYGFTLSEDHLYLTEDFFVHHNSGKSCTLQIIMADVIKRGGVVVKFDDPYLFIDGMRILRCIQKDTPIVVMMEDIDSIIKMHSESEVLNILDGVNEIERVVFLATTNYPGELGGRIVNRPSRFDKRFKIGFPKAESRRIYLQHIIGKSEINSMNIDLEQWVKDTKKFSIAHLKELFIAVVILGDKYEDAIETLRNMREDIDEKEKDQGVGFHVGKNDIDEEEED